MNSDQKIFGRKKNMMIYILYNTGLIFIDMPKNPIYN